MAYIDREQYTPEVEAKLQQLKSQADIILDAAGVPHKGIRVHQVYKAGDTDYHRYNATTKMTYHVVSGYVTFHDIPPELRSSSDDEHRQIMDFVGLKSRAFSQDVGLIDTADNFESVRRGMFTRTFTNSDIHFGSFIAGKAKIDKENTQIQGGRVDSRVLYEMVYGHINSRGNNAQEVWLNFQLTDPRQVGAAIAANETVKPILDAIRQNGNPNSILPDSLTPSATGSILPPGLRREAGFPGSNLPSSLRPDPRGGILPSGLRPDPGGSILPRNLRKP